MNGNEAVIEGEPEEVTAMFKPTETDDADAAEPFPTYEAENDDDDDVFASFILAELLEDDELDDDELDDDDDDDSADDPLQEYGTSAGASAGWDTRGRGRKGNRQKDHERVGSGSADDDDWGGHNIGEISDKDAKKIAANLTKGDRKKGVVTAKHLRNARERANRSGLRIGGGKSERRAAVKAERLYRQAKKARSGGLHRDKSVPAHQTPSQRRTADRKELARQDRGQARRPGATNHSRFFGESELEEAVLVESTDLIEARPAGPLKTGRLNRELNIIEGTTLIGPLSSNGVNKKRRYSETALKKIAEMAEGLPSYLNHVAPELAFKPRAVETLAGRHRNVRFDPVTQSVKSDMYIMPTQAPLVFGLAETFGDHIGNSLVSKGVVTMEGDTEVVQDILQLRSADLVSDPASTRGLFEGKGADDATPVTIVDLIESFHAAHMQHHQGGTHVDLAAILAYLKEKPEDQKLLAEHYGFTAKADTAKLAESMDAVKTELATAKAALAERDTKLVEAKVELDGFKAKDALAEKRLKLSEAIEAHPLKKEYGTKVKDLISTDFVTLLEGLDEAGWKKHLDDRYNLLRNVPTTTGQRVQSDLKSSQFLAESRGNGIPDGIHARVAASFSR